MRLHHLIAATLLLVLAGCTKDFNGTIACSSDVNCPTGYHCGSGGKCETGEASVAVQWVSPPDGAVVGGAKDFSVKVSHPDGVSSVKLMAGSTQLAVINTAAGTGATGLTQVNFTGVDTSPAPEGNTTLTAVGTSSKGASGNGTRAFLIDNHESTPTFAISSLFTGNVTTPPVLRGTAATGPSVSTVSLFASPDCTGTAVATGLATDFIDAGIQVPLIPNALTVYSAQSTDAAGNVSPCSNTVANGTFAFTNAQFCVNAAITSAQVFSPVLQGCGAKVTFANRGTLCAPGCRPATADEWVANFNSIAPTHHYWTDDALNFSISGCGAGVCNTNSCYAPRTNANASGCAAGQPMRVCAGTGAANFADPDGNTCTWTGCGYNSVAPKQFFGGCSGAADNTAGTLCVCGVNRYFVSATGGNDANPGTSASPFKTITKGLSVVHAGESVFVRPGTYNGANGEVFPLKVPAGAFLIGDEPGRGNTSGQPTFIQGGAAGCPLGTSTTGCSVSVGAGATVAGFFITGSVGDGIDPAAPGATIRSNTFSGNSGFNTHISSPNQTILLNAFTSNTGAWGILYSAGSTASGKVENNTFTGNQFGIEVDAPPGDMGGGAAGSIGNNIFSCNTGADLWMISTPVTASNNKWDHAPPTTSTSDSRGGMDYFTQAGPNVAGNTASINAGATVAPGTICP